MVKARMVLSEPEWTRGFKAHLKASNMGMVPWVGLVLMGVAALSWNVEDVVFLGIKIPAFAMRFLACWMTVLGVLVVFYPWIQLRLSRKYLRLHPAFDREIAWEMAPQGLKGTGEGFLFERQWELCRFVAVTRQGILVYPALSPQSLAIGGPGTFHWIPATAFATDADYQKTKQIIRNEMNKLCDASSSRYQSL